ncbi:MAG: DUF3137 domain-containing protein [Synergistaceae bacterium]|nr:DUF3137 domain-containing protein [Synergistaceae bacterium]
MDDLETIRLELENFRRGFKIFFIIFVVAVVAAGILLGMGRVVYIDDGKAMPGSLFGTVMAIFPALIVPFIVWKCTGAKKERAFKERFKSGIIAAELQNALEDVDYQPDSLYPKEYVAKLGIFRGFDKVKGNGYLRAKYRGQYFSRCDEDIYIVEEYEETDSDGDRVKNARDVHMFGGAITVLELASPFPARLLVCACGMNHVAAIPKQNDNPKEMSIFESVTDNGPESLKFKREYEISPGGDGAKAILTQHRMECIRKLDESVPHKFALLFEGDRLHLIVQDENFLEVKLGKDSPSVADQRDRVTGEVKKLIERLDLLLDMVEA